MNRTVSFCLMALAGLLALNGCGRDSAPLPDSGADIEVHLDSSTIRMGEPVTLSLIVRHDGNGSIRFPEFDSIPLVVLLDQTEEREELHEGLIRRTKRVTFTSYRPGARDLLPSPVLFITGEGRETALPVGRQIVRVQGEAIPDPDAVPGPIRKPSWHPLALLRRMRVAWILLGVVVAAAIAGFVTVRLFGKRRMEERQLIRESADEIARRALEALRSKEWDPEPFFTELSWILRTYLNDRFALDAPERTTEELVDLLRDETRLPTPSREMLPRFLELADQVKFARADAEQEVMQDAFDLVERFVEQTAAPDEPDPPTQTTPSPNPIPAP